MKKQKINRVDFSDIFSYAEDKFGIGWNPCNDMFFNHSLDYKSYNEYYQGQPLEYIKEGVEFDDLEFHEKGYYIINQFMIDNNLDDIFIDNR
jgi:hypothetical protein